MEFEVRGKFLDNSKAFDKIWHDGLIFKIHHQAIMSVFRKILRTYLMNDLKGYLW